MPAYLPYMLALSPPFPLIIDHVPRSHDLTAEDEGIMLALQHRDRLCRLFLRMPVLSLQKVIPAIDDEFPILEYLIVRPLGKHNSRLIPPSTFRAPHLRHLSLDHFSFPIGSPLLTTAIDLVGIFLR